MQGKKAGPIETKIPLHEENLRKTKEEEFIVVARQKRRTSCLPKMRKSYCNSLPPSQENTMTQSSCPTRCCIAQSPHHELCSYCMSPRLKGGPHSPHGSRRLTERADWRCMPCHTLRRANRQEALQQQQQCTGGMEAATPHHLTSPPHHTKTGIYAPNLSPPTNQRSYSPEGNA